MDLTAGPCVPAGGTYPRQQQTPPNRARGRRGAKRLVHHVGDTTVRKIWEMDLNGMAFDQLLSGLPDDARQRHPDWFPAGTCDAGNHACMSLHVWLVRHRGQTILVDTGAGNGKSRPQQAILDNLSTGFLSRLREAGVEPGEVDLILHTHIHSDHVGWNTTLVDGRWVPTFPNAEIIVSDLEFAYGLALAEGDQASIAVARMRARLGDPVRLPVSGTFNDSILPLMGRNPIRRIAVDGSNVLPGIRFLPTPGHSIDHASIELTDGGEIALFSGDVFHHPVEVYDPDLVSLFCEFPDASRRSRRWFLDHANTTEATVFSSHFPGSSAGRISRAAHSYRWDFIEG